MSLKFGDEGKTIIKNSLKFFDDNAHDYTKEVFLEKRSELEQIILSELFIIFEIQVRNIKRTIQKQFSERLSQIESDKSLGALSQLMANVKIARSQIESNMKGFLEKSIVLENIWDINPITQEIMEYVETEKRNCVEKLQNRFMKQKEKAYKNEIEKQVNLAFNGFHKEIWNDLNSFYVHQVGKIEKDLFSILKGSYIDSFLYSFKR